MEEEKPQENNSLFRHEISYRETNYKPIGHQPSEKMCLSCVEYYKELYEKGLTKRLFIPHCSRHVMEASNMLNKEDFGTEEEYIEALTILDPVTWAFEEFGWEAYWYQEWFLSCTASLKIARMGRQSGKTASMIIATLHHLYTNAYSKAILVAPRENQISMFFDAVTELIEKSKNLRDSITRSTKNPARIEFKNGGTLKGFTLNPNQGESAAVTIRGQPADLIIVDEMDFMADKDLNVLFAIKASRPSVKIIAASTPSGARANFYKTCTSKDIGWKEFWFISQESPRFTQETEEFFRGTLPEEGYVKEVYADFSELSEGVFKKRCIESSLRDYNLEEEHAIGLGIYILGVDWNKSHGTHMCILQNTGEGLKLVRKIIIPEEEYLQTVSVEKIIELNAVWGFKYIFVDAGYGAVQVESLKLHGQRNPRSKMNKILRPIAMNRMIDIKDVTGTESRKPTKPLLVQATAKLLEDGLLILPMSEDIDTSSHIVPLVKQMRNYKVESYSIYGQPVYSKENEHTLVAYMLAVGGFYMEEGDVFKQPMRDNRVVGIEMSGPVTEMPKPSDFITEKQYRENKSRSDINRGAGIIKGKHTITKTWGNDKENREKGRGSPTDFRRKTF